MITSDNVVLLWYLKTITIIVSITTHSLGLISATVHWFRGEGDNQLYTDSINRCDF